MAMFQVSTAKVLITGGTNGIGAGLAEHFMKAGAEVLITGRDAIKLEKLRLENPKLLTFHSDISKVEDRIDLANHVLKIMPDLNVLINNAGIQRRIGIAKDDGPWVEKQLEIDTLLSGPIHLISLLCPLMVKNDRSGLIINITSGGAYIPQTFAPLYSACKAALHSYTVNLRYSLHKTSIKTIEIVPPAVSTGLAGPGKNHGAPLNEFCDTIFPQIINANTDEIGYGPTATTDFKEAQEPNKKLFNLFAQRFDTPFFNEREN